MTFEVTVKAQRFMRLMLAADGKPGSGFRLAVKPGGCSGLASEIAVLSAPEPGDSVVDLHGIRIFLPFESRILLAGVTIDFADTATQTGLVFHDPKATGVCSSAAKEAVD